VFFTSGSTGTPKGVFDSHRNVLHNVRRYTNALAISADDRLTLLQSCAFSGSVSSLFGALLNGATIFPFDFARQGPVELGRLLQREQLTIYHSVPSIFRSFLTGSIHLPRVRVIRLEGDRATSLDAELYRRHFGPHCVLANGLGTTETGLCRQYLIDRSTKVADGILPVGYPVEDMEVEILDEQGSQVEVGQQGEITVRSRYLALGYWRRPDLTGAAFRSEPDGKRTYRTGDMGRMRPDGCLEYLGRKDFQPKIRGHRVDIADVESQLIAANRVKDAVVTTREKENGEAELVAYVVTDDANPLEAAALRSELGRTLPSHLIPTRFLQLDALPVNDSGKVDRNNLPSPAEVGRRRRLTLPRTPLEKQLVEIWQDALDTSPVGLDDSLLDLGGDSLVCAVIAARIEEMGYRVAPDGLVGPTTVAQLADALGSNTGSVTSLVAIEPSGRSAPLFLVHDLNGAVGRYVELARWLGPDQPLWALRYTREHDTIESMAEQYLHEIRTVQATGPYRLGGWCFGAVVALEIARQLHASDEEVTLLALIGISAFDFSHLVSASAWRAYQVRVDQEQGSSRLDRRIRRHVCAARALTVGQGTVYLLRAAARPVLRAARGRGSSSTPPSACRAAFRRYTPRAYDGRALLILAETETAAYSDDPKADWRDLSSDGVDILIVPGGHEEVLVEPNVRVVGDHLRLKLAASSALAADSKATSMRSPASSS
jgi:thioesterase domain-containing protein